MSIDDKVGRDPRITILALALGWSKRELVGCLVLDVWPLCYDQESALVSERIIDAAAGHPGFAVAMVEAELATRDRSGKLRITGAAKRIAYLDHQKKSGREGGLKSAELRANRSKGTPRVREASLKQTSSDGQGSGNPSVPDTVPDTATAPDTAPDAVPEDGDPAGAGSQVAHQPAVAEFDSRYRAAYETKPTWGAKQVGQLKKLVASHGIDEVLRRIGVLFEAPPSFLAGPHDVGTLVQHFDKLVRPASPRPAQRAAPPRESGLDVALRIARGE